MNIAAQIKNLRLSKGITQKELAEQTGIALQSIINYENGRREPNSKAMAALERYFGVSGEFLRGGVDRDTRLIFKTPSIRFSLHNRCTHLSDTFHFSATSCAVIYSNITDLLKSYCIYYRTFKRTISSVQI